ncbi:hypothetical protein BpHYR1_028939 [Brachionus plicatilis]|uniref:Uncharacterized protein n=1 Tax=Brachionus plicatilis TaxID=10195 RepID=A0A3M7R1P3_BRAPC|nr:hypothetical protein BpHYR1_028939 [Brachionus plicatilis]
MSSKNKEQCNIFSQSDKIKSIRDLFKNCHAEALKNLTNYVFVRIPILHSIFLKMKKNNRQKYH